MNDNERMNRIAVMPCVCCESMKVRQPFRTEVHHIVSSGYRRLSGGHSSTIPLDSWHHRGICLDGMKSAQMEAIYGPSMALRKREFIKVFGTELQLLERVNASLYSSGDTIFRED